MAQSSSALLRSCLLIVFATLAAACTNYTGGDRTSGPPAGPTPTAPSVPSVPSVGAPTEPASSPTDGVQLTQAWATAELTDVRNGQRFRIADLVADGRVVFLETMAIWCTNCRRQQGDVVSALSQLDPATVTWIGIDVDASESADALADYSRTLGFDWPFVVAGPDLARALAAEFGDQVLSPPSTPIVVIGTDGRVTLTEFGHKSVDRIMQLATEYGA
jgi:thiol-disulfide isomerase/thioredoxin